MRFLLFHSLPPFFSFTLLFSFILSLAPSPKKPPYLQLYAQSFNRLLCGRMQQCMAVAHDTQEKLSARSLSVLLKNSSPEGVIHMGIYIYTKSKTELHIS